MCVCVGGKLGFVYGPSFFLFLCQHKARGRSQQQFGNLFKWKHLLNSLPDYYVLNPLLSQVIFSCISKAWIKKIPLPPPPQQKIKWSTPLYILPCLWGFIIIEVFIEICHIISNLKVIHVILWFYFSETYFLIIL